MATKKNIINYIYNPSTLLYEKKVEAKWKKYAGAAGYTLAVVALVVLYFWFYTSALGLDLPKTAHLKKVNAKWQSQISILSRELDKQEAILAGIEQRDDDVYRCIFGLEPIPQEVKNAGFGGTNRYAYLDPLGPSSNIRAEVKRLDVMTKRAYLQSKALDEILVISKQAEDMLSCVPAVPPILPQTGTYRVSSPFGVRNDPVFRKRAFHDGIDLATSKGNPVYATGNGVVVKVKKQPYIGYGNEVVVDHGFGYKTRYAHLHTIDVVSGQVLRRGDRIGTVGSTGKSTGPHLHYEVLYRGKAVNPWSFMDLAMGVDEYKAMVDRGELREVTVLKEADQPDGGGVQEEVVEYGF